jgi:hypothetical protein
LKDSHKERKRKTDEWDLRERHWNRMVRNPSASSFKLGTKKKVDPRKRFKLMLVSLVIFVICAALLTISVLIPIPHPGYQSVAPMFSTIISGGVFAGKYGKDVIGTLAFSLSKNSLR